MCLTHDGSREHLPQFDAIRFCAGSVRDEIAGERVHYSFVNRNRNAPHNSAVYTVAKIRRGIVPTYGEWMKDLTLYVGSTGSISKRVKDHIKNSVCYTTAISHIRIQLYGSRNNVYGHWKWQQGGGRGSRVRLDRFWTKLNIFGVQMPKKSDKEDIRVICISRKSTINRP